MKVVILRHATRSTHGLGDSSLNSTGESQALNLINYLAPNGPLPSPTLLLSSPKKRAQQTLAPLSHHLHLPVIVDPRLDERHQNESARDFDDRVRSLIREIEAMGETASSDACVYLCSHLDWLEHVLVALNSDLSELELALSWPTAGFKVFKIEEGLWRAKGGGAVPPGR